jgi:exodeoxyribonuclease VII large subunit
LTRYLKQLLEQDSLLQKVSVAGEVSNLTYHGSGHVYFSIKDQEAQLSCAMFKRVAFSAPRLKAGDQIVATGSISVYAPRGSYQLIVSSVEKAGLGDLYQRFIALKEKLQREGLFSSDQKKKIPRYPRRIAVVTSPTGAAIQDIRRTIERRYSAVELIIVPAIVQGDRGASSIIAALQAAEQLGPDIILLSRGGGSLEDLWNFNEESVARAIHACNTPVVTGIGHETDVTIAGFVADLRAATPTAAAERIVPEKTVLVEGLSQARRLMSKSLEHYIDFRRQVLDDYTERLRSGLGSKIQERRHQLSVLSSQSQHHMLGSVVFKRQVLQDYQRRMDQALQEKCTSKLQELALLSAKLEAMNRDTILNQGYTLTLKEGKIVQSAKAFLPGEKMETVFGDGRVSSRVQADDSPKTT